LTFATAPMALHAAEPWSSFAPANHDTHAAVRQPADATIVTEAASEIGAPSR
jgi:hypothetical protein